MGERVTCELSIIMPAYNEAGSIVAAIKDIQTHVLSVVPDAEIIVIDDGSTDATLPLLHDVAQSVPRLRIVSQANAGHGPALLRGLAEAKGRSLLLLDSDLQIKLDQFADDWARMARENLIAVIGIRRPRHDPPHRLVITRLMRALIFLAFGAAPKDAGVPYKILRREAWDIARTHISEGSWIPSVLTALILLRTQPRRVREITVVHLARDHGTTSLNYKRLARFCRHASAEILKLRRDLRRI
jgi:dolichol-phosphate mannosyltransferase